MMWLLIHLTKQAPLVLKSYVFLKVGKVTLIFKSNIIIQILVTKDQRSISDLLFFCRIYDYFKCDDLFIFNRAFSLKRGFDFTKAPLWKMQSDVIFSIICRR